MPGSRPPGAAMFESLSTALSGALTALRGRGKLTESNIREGLSAVRTALL